MTAKEDSVCRQVAGKEWIHVECVGDQSEKKMYKAKPHDGEVEVMVLAQEGKRADLVIIDDNAAKKTDLSCPCLKFPLAKSNICSIIESRRGSERKSNAEQGVGQMGHVLEPQKEAPQERAARERYCKVAVGCWFTAGGKAIPQMLKYEDEEGCLHRIDSIQVLCSDRKHYYGILMQRYDCRAEIGGTLREFSLLYHPGENTWDLVIR